MTVKKRTILMPVGEKAGEKVSMSKTEADNIEGVFGKYEDPKNSLYGPQNAIAALEKSLASEKEHSESLASRAAGLEKSFKDTLGERMELTKASDEALEEQTKRANEAEAKAVELESLLESAMTEITGLEKLRDGAATGGEDKVIKK